MTLTDAQAAFRRSPGRATALAYMDAAIEAWSATPGTFDDAVFGKRMQEIRDWLMNARHWRDPVLHPEGIESQ